MDGVGNDQSGQGGGNLLMPDKVDPGDLKVGMYVEWIGSGEFHDPIERIDRFLLDKEEVDTLKARNPTVVFVNAAMVMGGGCRPDLAPVADTENMARCRAVYQSSLEFVRDSMEAARKGCPINADGALSLVDSIIHGVLSARSAMVMATRLKDYDEYTYAHGVNVCVFSTLFGRALGLPLEALRVLGQAAMLHDIGKARIPKDVLNKPGKLNPVELKIMQTHPMKGHGLLSECRNVHPSVLRVALEHHEKRAGHGYPRGLFGNRIGQFSRIVSICDVYDAMTSNRVYHKARHPNEVLGLMYSWKQKDFDPEYVDRFIKCMGVYPEGSWVRLSDGRVAVIIKNNQEQLLRPAVRVMYDANLAPCERKDVDLSHSFSFSSLNITESVHPKDLPLDAPDSI